MRDYKKVGRVKIETIVSSIKCDKCGVEAPTNNSLTGPIDWEEEEFYDDEEKMWFYKKQCSTCWLMIDEEDDLTYTLEADLCPKCFQEVLGPYLHKREM